MEGEGGRDPIPSSRAMEWMKPGNHWELSYRTRCGLFGGVCRMENIAPKRDGGQRFILMI
jgi:hypothetical protein